MKHVHRLIRPSASAIKLPRRIGVIRAYVAKAMEYGMDSGFLNAANHFGESPADKKLMELVDAFANMDGSTGNTDKAISMIDKFAATKKKPKKKKA